MSNNLKKVLCPMERKGKTHWMRVGSAFINSDGSTNVYLDAFPANGKLQIRDLDERDLKKPESGAGANQPSSALPF
ncbi:MAG: hypothetical protein GY811_29520 [Myxococcales bacterium]|nr:hypothetical protein [Myxococcales bacterium]